MITRPTDEEIRAAELRVEFAERELEAGKARTKAAFLDFVVHPATLLGIAVAAGAAGYAMFKPKYKAPAKFEWPWRKGVSPEVKQTTATSILSILVAFGMRYAMQNLPSLGYRLAGEALRRHRARAAAAAVPVRTSSTNLH